MKGKWLEVLVSKNAGGFGVEYGLAMDGLVFFWVVDIVKR